MDRSIQVHADWTQFPSPQLMGELHESSGKGKSVVSFTYDECWLKGDNTNALDPELQLYAGQQYPPVEKPNFGVFLDSSPDRWGRMLIRRREGRSPHRLTEVDFLLGVNDFARTGALRYKTNASEEYLAPGKENTVPPFARLRTLEEAARHVEEDDDGDEVTQWLSLLLAPGSSLGGARPKASILGPDGDLWIAKFPSKNDHNDTGAWEMVARELSRRCGLKTPSARLERFTARGSTYLSKRFDRTADGRRIHFVSALTLMGKSDGASAADGSSYLELAEFIRRYGAKPKKDLEELWSRIVFNIAVSNTDDHLRNHGFLLTPQGWSLSPVYDVNPEPDGTGLSLNISEDDNSLDFDLAIEQSRHFLISENWAARRVEEIQQVVAGWQKVAGDWEIPSSAVRKIEAAFLN